MENNSCCYVLVSLLQLSQLVTRSNDFSGCFISHNEYSMKYFDFFLVFFIIFWFIFYVNYVMMYELQTTLTFVFFMCFNGFYPVLFNMNKPVLPTP